LVLASKIRVRMMARVIMRARVVVRSNLGGSCMVQQIKPAGEVGPVGLLTSNQSNNETININQSPNHNHKRCKT
jgi:hypothetical protein